MNRDRTSILIQQIFRFCHSLRQQVADNSRPAGDHQADGGRRCIIVLHGMAGSGSGIFPEPDDYGAQLPGTRVFLLVAPALFRARLEWVDLRRLRLLRGQETAARVRYTSLPRDRAFVTFPVHRDTTLICGGIVVGPGNIIFHASGEHYHERIAAPSTFGIISMHVETLSLFARTLTGKEIELPPAGLVIRPRPADRLQLLRLHARASRLVQTNIDMIMHPEVSRALEEDLVLALMTCLSADSRPHGSPADLREPVMVRLEEALAACPDQIPGVTEMSGMIGVPQAALQSCCLKVMGMSPERYLFLRRLIQVQALLKRAGFAVASISDVPRRHGFADIHHFVTEYQRAFGSVPAQSQ